MQRDDESGDMLDAEDVSIVRSEVSALEAISRSEVAAQLDAAHRYPRSPTRFLRDATSLATFTREIAEACMYSLPRGGKIITGKSVRLAEICASSWGNLHIGSRVLDATDKEVIAQAIAWDLQTNVRVTIEAQRGILKSNGKRYDDDMVRVTGMAAISVALRNAVFRVIPGAYVDPVYQKAREVAVGDAKTLVSRRDEWLARLGKMGVMPDRVFARLGVHGANDITLDHIATLIGVANAVRNGEADIDEAFPPVPSVAVPVGAPSPAAAATPAAASSAPPAPAAAAAPEGRRTALTGKRRGGSAPATPEATSAPTEPASAPAEAPPPAPAAAAAPSAASPPPAASKPDPIAPAEVVRQLGRVDAGWRAPVMLAVVEGWTEVQRWAALTWAEAVLNDGPMALQSQRPPHTVLKRDREPGEEG